VIQGRFPGPERIVVDRIPGPVQLAIRPHRSDHHPVEWEQQEKQEQGHGNVEEHPLSPYRTFDHGSADLYAADVEPDPAAREELVKSALTATETDFVLLPLVNYPKSGAWRTDKVGGPLDGDTANYRAFDNFHQWEDVDGDGQIVIGAEQWPACLNPVTECANSSWSVWTVTFPFLPSIWVSTNDQTFEITNLVTEEPVVEVAE
jgi:hypothetical protein